MCGLKITDVMGTLGYTREALNSLSAQQKYDLINMSAAVKKLDEKGIKLIRLTGKEAGEDILTLSSKENDKELAVLPEGVRTNFLQSIRSFGSNPIEALKKLLKDINEKKLAENTDNKSGKVFEPLNLYEYA